MQIDLIFGLIVLVFSVILHEVAHGYMANYLGDPTARLAGRLTLNPIKHIDPLGSILLPGILLLSNAPFLIGYAKPVPYNPYNLRGKFGETLVAASGPATNILIALIFGLLMRFGGAAIEQTMLEALAVIVFINILLAIFNLIPIPPLDGSKVLSGILPGPLARGYEVFRMNFERLGVLSGTLLLLLILYVFQVPFFSFISMIFEALTGFNL